MIFVSFEKRCGSNINSGGRRRKELSRSHRGHSRSRWASYRHGWIGNRALRLCRKRHFDLITTDLLMDGLELIRALRVTGCQTPVLLISGSRQFLPIVKLLRAEVLCKPFEFRRASCRHRQVPRNLFSRGLAEITIQDNAKTQQRHVSDVPKARSTSRACESLGLTRMK